jgi:hypothetical protein
MIRFLMGFVLASLIVGLAGWWLLEKERAQRIRFPVHLYYDDRDPRPNSGYVAVTGTLTGEDMEGDTFVKVTCTRPANECAVINLQLLNRHSAIYVDDFSWTITRWDDEKIVAESTPVAEQCSKVTFTIYRTSEEAIYTRSPAPKANDKLCRNLFSKQKVFNWKVAAQPTS